MPDYPKTWLLQANFKKISWGQIRQFFLFFCNQKVCSNGCPQNISSWRNNKNVILGYFTHLELWIYETKLGCQPSRHTTLYQRQFNVDSTSRRWINVESTLFQHCVPTESVYKYPKDKIFRFTCAWVRPGSCIMEINLSGKPITVMFFFFFSFFLTYYIITLHNVFLRDGCRRDNMTQILVQTGDYKTRNSPHSYTCACTNYVKSNCRPNSYTFYNILLVGVTWHRYLCL